MSAPRHRRPKPTARPRAPAAPRDAYARGGKPSAGSWDWRPGEVAYGPPRRTLEEVLASCWPAGKSGRGTK
jgi:hypothetical protein